MNIYHIELERMQKRLKKLEENLGKNPDPTKLKTNKLLYEIDIEARQAQSKAWKEGKLFFGGQGIPILLGMAMGLIPMTGANMVPDVPQDLAMQIFDEVRAGGAVGDSCDMSIMVYSLRDHVEGLTQKIDICHQHPCAVQYLASLYRTYAGYTNQKEKTIYYYMDIGYEENEANLKHVEAQLREFIEFAEEKVPGIKYDESKLIELQECSEKAHNYFKDIYAMLRNKPCPLGGRDAFWQVAPMVPGMYPNPYRAIEYAKARCDEIAERVEKGIAAVPNEKKRVVWTVTRPFFMDNFKVLSDKGIVVPLSYSGATNMRVPFPQNKYWGERKLSPLEKVAADSINQLWSGTGEKWVEHLIWVCKDLKIDGVINYLQRGAPCTLGLKKLVEEAVEKQLDIPTLQLEGTQWDSSYASETQINNKLSEFADLLLS
ncbi:MAG: 2-hydroxyacyl-CoA dehydratase [Dehalococcoidales bacterium]|nr:2-hydroxyacyl-CoA dehydratase [Dehalococcoidales bacterium]